MSKLTASEKRVVASVLAALQVPQAQQPVPSKANFVASLAQAKATVGRCYPTHYNVLPGGNVPDTKIVCPNGAYAVLTSSNTLYWMDAVTREAVAQWDAACTGHAEMVAAVRAQYPAHLKVRAR